MLAHRKRRRGPAIVRATVQIYLFCGPVLMITEAAAAVQAGLRALSNPPTGYRAIARVSQVDRGVRFWS
jgi:hypothetical protein